MNVRDGGGSISSVELGQVMRTFGWAPTEMELQELISEIDQDGNGSISFNEFVWLMTKYVFWFARFLSIQGLKKFGEKLKESLEMHNGRGDQHWYLWEVHKDGKII